MEWVNDIIRFKELLFTNEEFQFFYNGKIYEIISQYGRSIFECNQNEDILISSFKTNQELLDDAIINGQKLKNAIDKIKIKCSPFF